MTLEEKIILVNQLIKEDRDHTIRDYLDIVEEIELVEQTLKKSA